MVESGCQYIILRTSWLYSEFGRNFFKTMQSLTATRSELKVVADQIGTPTYAGDLAAAITYIIDSEQLSKRGIYHFSNLGLCSWCDFATEIARQCGNLGCKVESCTTAEYPTRALRPKYSVLDKSKFISTFSFAIPEWKESLERCVQSLKS